MTKGTYSRGHPGKFGLCIDWETSGSDFVGKSHETYQGLAYGAVIFDTETFEPVETLYRELYFDSARYKWSDEAEKIHGLSQAHLGVNGVSREDGLVDLLELIVKYFGTGDAKIMFLGHNVDFDIDFTCQLADDFGVDIRQRIYHVKLETSGASFIMTGKYRSNDVFEIFTGKVREGGHNALDDALLSLETARNMRALVALAMEPQ